MIKFILNKPRNPKNIGAAARGMANFGFRDLAVVEPYSKAWRETRSAVHASDVVKKAKKFRTIKEAARSSHVVIGTSAGYRRRLAAEFIGLDELRAIVDDNIKAGRSVAIVFGSEKTGLTNLDLGHCHYITRIPTDPKCPSMNLAQAVAVVAYALGHDIKSAPRPTKNIGSTPDKPVPVEKVERLVAQGYQAFMSAGLLKGWTKERSEDRIRRAFYQWNLTPVDIAMLHSLFRWVIKNGDRVR